MLSDESDDENDYEREISSLRTKLQIVERKLVNAKHLSDAHEKFAKEVQESERKSKAEALKYKQKWNKTKEKYDILNTNIQISKLESSCEKLQNEIFVMQKAIQEIIQTTDDLTLPIHVGRRKKIQKFQTSLNKLKHRFQNKQTILKDLLHTRSLNKKLKDAAISGDLDSVLDLMSQGVGINVIIPENHEQKIANNDGMFTAFEYACGQGHYEIVKAMIGIADINCPNSKKSAPIHLAVKSQNSNVVELLAQNGANLEVTDKAGRTPIHLACVSKDINCVNILLEKKVNLDQQDNHGNSCLHYCARHDLYDVAYNLLERGSNTKLKNSEGLTPSMVALKEGNDKIVNLLE